VRDEKELAAVQEFAKKHRLEIVASVPFDESFVEAERAEASPVDFNPEAPAVEAIAGLARKLSVNGSSNGGPDE